MEDKKIIRVKTITEGHRMQQLPMPAHPLISIIDVADLKGAPGVSVVLEFYTISMKRNSDGFIYGHQPYDFDGGLMAFMAPNQVAQGRQGGPNPNMTGWMLFVHPDLLWNTPLATKIKEYEYFNYSTNEALFLSEKEEAVINEIIANIKHEYNANIDNFSQTIIIAHLETLFSYAERFYNRQFITRKKASHQILNRLEKLLSDYFNSDDLVTKGLPSVQYIADSLNVSQGYLSSLLKVLTGQSTQQHIHEKLIAKAKEKLSTTNLSVGEIAYQLGFEHPQSFSKFFKAKANVSPLEFRQSFN
ncbi:helix-turn-helix domain-containing protein [Parachryseolinea silvisoli]|jgi:AraC family transcriptional regulator, transcriptional activator of pobA|uniref:helix-turn-helix domain-containing protein n=1 Tax=Parachryseolinea silvisoli TaxID=2873601 RepID=UPI002265EE7F|nr:response regulator transcription factor [Parachryseolinea silvisoli]MCD9015729.1 helix-turn-helix transcriptional regulator [Parachryseolinea silvisoli]